MTDDQLTYNEIKLIGWEDISVRPQSVYNLECRELKLYMCLIDCAQNGRHAPSLEKLEAYLNTEDDPWSQRTIKRAMRGLTEKGYIERQRRFKKPSITFVFKEPYVQDTDGPTSEDTDGPTYATTTKIKNGNSNKTPIFVVWEQEAKQPLSPFTVDDLKDFVGTDGYDTTVEAIKEAVQAAGAGRFTTRYVAKILHRWRTEGRDAPKPDPSVPEDDDDPYLTRRRVTADD